MRTIEGGLLWGACRWFAWTLGVGVLGIGGLDLYAQAPDNDLFENRMPVAGSRVTTTGSNVNATREAAEPTILGKAGGKSVWWVWTAPQSGKLIVDLSGSDFDTLAAVYLGKSLGSLSLIGADDNSGADGKTSRALCNVEGGTDYNIAVEGLQGASGNIKLSLRLVTLPEITLQPVNVTISERQNASFTVNALGAEPLSYRWQFKNSDGQWADLAGAKSAALDLHAVTMEQGGDYRAMVSNSYGQTNSSFATLTVFPVPKITEQPRSQTVDAGANVQFSVDAAGRAPLLFQWFFNDALLSGETNRQLSLRDVRPKHQGGYYAVVTNYAGSDTSMVAQLQVIVHPPAISKQPGDVTNNVGDSALFQVRADGSSPLLYQWFFNGTALAGQTQPDLALDNVATNQAGGYAVRISNEYGVTNSRTAQLKVIYHLPAITNQPKDLLVVTGETAFFSVQATGSEPLLYQWFFNGKAMAGETADSLFLSNVRTNQQGDYSVQVKNAFGSATSRNAHLTVVTRPPNDDFTNRIPILVTNTPVKGWNNYATREPGEPNHGQAKPLPTNSVWWSWTAPEQSGLATIDLKGSQIDSLLAVYSGTGLGNLRLVASNDNSVDGGVASKVIFQTAPFEDYILAVDTARGGQGDIQLAIRFSTDITPPEFTLQPFDLWLFGAWGGGLGGGCEDASFSVTTVSIAQPVTYRWQFQGAQATVPTDIPGATSPVLTLADVTTAQAGSYWAIASNLGGSSTSRVAVLQVQPGPGLVVIDPTLKQVREGEKVVFSVTSRGCPPLTNQWRFNGSPIPGANIANLQLTAVNPTHAGLYDVVVSNPGGSATSALARLEVDAIPRIDTQPKGASVRDGENVALTVKASSYSPLSYVWYREGERVPDATNATCSFLGRPFSAGAYRVVVSNPWASVTSQWAQVTVDPRPRIEKQPAGQPAKEGQEVLLYVVASSYTPLRYQWVLNGAAVPEATESNLQFVAAQETAGDYFVVVSNDWASVTSQVAKVTVGEGPIVITKDLQDLRVKSGDTVDLTLEALSFSSMSFRWRKDKTNDVGVDASHLLTVGTTNTSYRILNAQPVDSGAYQVTISNKTTTSVSRAATVRVVDPPGNDHFTNRFRLAGTNVTTTGHNEFATKEPGEPNHAKKAGGRSVWWTWTAPQPGTNTIDLSGSRTIAGGVFDTLLGVYEGDRVDALTEVASDDQGGSDGRTSKVRFPVERGVTYQIAVDGNSGEEGNIQLRLDFAVLISPPVITRQPDSQAARFGSSVAFSVDCKGSPRIFYQWRFEGNELPGETNATLRIPNFQSSQEGNYTVVLRNLFGSTESQVAQLTSGAIVGGMVTDATNGEPIPHAKVSAGDITTYTDTKGNYRLVGVKPGAVQAGFDANTRRLRVNEIVSFCNQSTVDAVILTGTHTNYFDYVNDQIDVPSGQTITLSFSMSPKLEGMRFVLNWGLNPADLDGTLMTPNSGLVNYVRRGSTNEPPFAILDHDVTSSYGPETITIYRFVPGTYRYFVKKYNLNAAGQLPTSESTVKLYTDSGLYGSRKIPTSGSGRFWHVCDVVVDRDSTNVVWINRLQDNQPEPLTLHPDPTGPIVEENGMGARGYAVAMTSAYSPLRRQADSGSQTNFTWDFGDGSAPDTAREPAHQYRAPGVYTVTLRMTYVRGEKRDEATLTKQSFITVVDTPPTVAIEYPQPGQLFRAGTTVPVRVAAHDADIEGVVSKVELFADNRKLVTWTQATNVFLWDSIPEGAHTLTAVATDNFGTNSGVATVRIQALDLSGDIVIVRNFDDPEIGQLASLLSEYLLIYDTAEKGWRKVVTRVLDQEGLWFHLVESFKLIIWHDLGEVSQGLTDNDVAVFQQAYTNGISLYFMGEKLTASATNLASVQKAQWLDLIHLRSAGETTAPGRIVRTNFFTSHPLLDYNFGTVEGFSYPTSLETVTLADTNAEAVATMGGSTLMALSPPIGQDPDRGARTVSQDFPALSQDSTGKLDDQRTILCLNSAAWLMFLDCQQVNLWLETSVWQTNALQEATAVTEDTPLRPRDALTYQITVHNNMECNPSGVMVTNRLAANAKFESATSERGVFSYDSTKHEVVFRLFLLPKGEASRLSVTVSATAPGLMTNSVSVGANYALKIKTYQTVHTVSAPFPASQRPELKLEPGKTGEWLVKMATEIGFSYTLQTSTDLRQWTTLTNFYSTNTLNLFTDRSANRDRTRFYRATSP